MSTNRYGPGQSFGKHIDDSVEISFGVHTEYTLLIYLNGASMAAVQGKQKTAPKGSCGLVGGETIFYGTAFSHYVAVMCVCYVAAYESAI